MYIKATYTRALKAVKKPFLRSAPAPTPSPAPSKRMISRPLPILSAAETDEGAFTRPRNLSRDSNASEMTVVCNLALDEKRLSEVSTAEAKLESGCTLDFSQPGPHSELAIWVDGERIVIRHAMFPELQQVEDEMIVGWRRHTVY